MTEGQTRKRFPFTRVDFCLVEEKIYFGEITFFPGACLVKFESNHADYDRVFGDMLDIEPLLQDFKSAKPSPKLATR